MSLEHEEKSSPTIGLGNDFYMILKAQAIKRQAGLH